MLNDFQKVLQVAVGLLPEQRTSLANLLIESTHKASIETSVIWEAEILSRIAAIDDGREIGSAYDDVMREAEKHLGR